VTQTFRLSRRLCTVAEAVIARHLSQGTTLILEAFWLLPEFAARMTSAHTVPGEAVQALFLYDDAERRNGPGNQAAALAAHSLAIKTEALDLGLPVLASRPFETLAARAIATLSAA
jgi:hypothetical protein